MNAPPMLLPDVIALLHASRRDEDVVISSMGSAREWMALGPLHERDLVFVPSAMGHATSVGLGLARQQDRRDITLIAPWFECREILGGFSRKRKSNQAP